jgi:small-conductance mechanosensitive channel
MNIFYSLANLGVFFWTICEVGMFMPINDQMLRLSWIASYVSGAFIAANVAIFSFYFPFAKNVNKKLIFTIFLLFLVLLIFLLTSGIIVKPTVLSADFSLLELRASLWGSVIYGVYLIIMFYIFFKNFIEKYINVDGFAKSQIKLILIGVSISLIVGLISNVIAPIYIGSRIGWLGPLSSVVMAFFAVHLLFFKQDKHI